MSEKRKSRKELEQLLWERDREISRLKKEYEILKDKFIAACDYLDHTPSDCKRGVWCETCQYARSFHICNHYNRDYGTVWVCTKEVDTCSNYIKRRGIGD